MHSTETNALQGSLKMHAKQAQMQGQQSTTISDEGTVAQTV